MANDKQPGYKNLKRGRWKKGESGNPNGRPKKDICLTSLLKKLLDEVPEGEKGGRTWAQLIALVLVRGALKGDRFLIEMVLERVDGKVPQPLQHSGPNEGPIEMSLIDALHKKAKEHKEAKG